MTNDTDLRNGTPPVGENNRIEPEGPDAIRVGAGRKLRVPHEDYDADLDEGAELDLMSGQPLKVRRPGRHEWVVIKRDSEFQARLLVHKPCADGIDAEYYYVANNLRGPLHDDLRLVRVFVYFSLSAKTFGLWLVKVAPGNSWYESLHQLLKQPTSFFTENVVRLVSDRASARYRAMKKASPVPSVTWPTASTGELLGEALGDDHFIRSPDHPVYRELTEPSILVAAGTTSRRPSSARSPAATSPGISSLMVRSGCVT